MDILICKFFEPEARFVFKDGASPEKGSDTPPAQPSGTRQEGSLQERMQSAVTRGQDALAKADQLRKESTEISQKWKDKKEVPGGSFSGGDYASLTAGKVNMRDMETGRIIGPLPLKKLVKIKPDPKRVEVNGVNYVAIDPVKDGGPYSVYIAERYLEKTVPQKVYEAAQGKERIEIPEGEMLEEVVLFRGARQFPEGNTADTWNRFAAEYKATILDKGLAGSAAKDAELAVYKKIFGPNANLYEDKIQRSFELAAEGKGGKLKEEVEVRAEVSPDKLDAVFTELLGKMGHEIGAYYGMGPMTGEQIREAFGFSDIPHNRIGEKGTAISFDYQHGQLAISIPARQETPETFVTVSGKATVVPGSSAAPSVEIPGRDLNIHYKDYAQMQAKRRERFAQKYEALSKNATV